MHAIDKHCTRIIIYLGSHVNKLRSILVLQKDKQQKNQQEQRLQQQPTTTVRRRARPSSSVSPSLLLYSVLSSLGSSIAWARSARRRRRRSKLRRESNPSRKLTWTAMPVMRMYNYNLEPKAMAVDNTAHKADVCVWKIYRNWVNDPANADTSRVRSILKRLYFT